MHMVNKTSDMKNMGYLPRVLMQRFLLLEMRMLSFRILNWIISVVVIKRENRSMQSLRILR